jgi:hypothetical protein
VKFSPEKGVFLSFRPSKISPFLAVSYEIFRNSRLLATEIVQNRPNFPENGPKTAKNGRKTPENGPKMAENGPKIPIFVEKRGKMGGNAWISGTFSLLDPFSRPEIEKMGGKTAFYSVISVFLGGLRLISREKSVKFADLHRLAAKNAFFDGISTENDDKRTKNGPKRAKNDRKRAKIDENGRFSMGKARKIDENAPKIGNSHRKFGGAAKKHREKYRKKLSFF